MKKIRKKNKKTPLCMQVVSGTEEVNESHGQCRKIRESGGKVKWADFLYSQGVIQTPLYPTGPRER